MTAPGDFERNLKRAAHQAIRHAHALDERARRAGWRVCAAPTTGSPVIRIAEMRADRWSPLDDVATAPALTYRDFPFQRYALPMHLLAHPRDLPLVWRAGGTPRRDPPPDIGGLRAYWNSTVPSIFGPVRGRRTRARRQRIADLRRFWRDTAPYEVRILLADVTVALDPVERTAYLPGAPDVWWTLALDVHLSPLQPLDQRWAALVHAAHTPERADELEWLWDRMDPGQREQAQRRAVAGLGRGT